MMTKTITKLVSINDGENNEINNGNRLYLVNYPRTEKIINAFLNDGWSLHSKEFRVVPSIQGAYAFYLGGWDMLFVKEIPSDQDDDSDSFLHDVIAKILEEEPAIPEVVEDDDDEFLDDFDLDDEEY